MALGFCLLGFDKEALAVPTDRPEAAPSAGDAADDSALVHARARPIWRLPAIKLETLRFSSNSDFPDISQTEQDVQAERLARIVDEELSKEVTDANYALKKDLLPGDHMRSKALVRAKVRA
jgi:hypothetical protein